MNDLEQLGREVAEQLGEPPGSWLQAQRRELREALDRPVAERRVSRRALVVGLSSAVGLAAVALFMRVRDRRESREIAEVVVEAPVGGGKRLGLADGSSLSLDPRSLARVWSGTDTTRCVVERGTVLFEVAPQKQRSFTVVAGALEVRVVGTRFSVSRDAANVVDVRVDHGVVRVFAPRDSGPVELRAGDHLRSDGNAIAPMRSTASEAPQNSPAVVDEPTPPPSASAPTLEPEAATPKQGPAAPADWQALYQQRNYAEALAVAKQSGEARLLNGLNAASLAELADAARLAGDTDFALRAFATLERRFAGSPRAQDAVFLSGRLYAGRGQPDAAQIRFEQYLARNAQGPYSLEATGRLVALYAAHGDSRAKVKAKAYLNRSPHGPYERLCRSVLAAP